MHNSVCNPTWLFTQQLASLLAQMQAGRHLAPSCEPRSRQRETDLAQSEQRKLAGLFVSPMTASIIPKTRSGTITLAAERASQGSYSMRLDKRSAARDQNTMTADECLRRMKTEQRKEKPSDFT